MSEKHVYRGCQLVRPSLEYANCVWDPHTQTAKQKLEAVQRRAARYVTRRYHNTRSVTNMLHHLEWQTLEQRKIATNQLCSTRYQTTLLHSRHIHYIPYPLDTSPTRSHNLRYMPYQCNTNTLKYSFFPRTIILWNSLPSHIASAPTLTCSRTQCLPGRTPSQQLQSNTAQLIKCTPARLALHFFRAHCCIITCIYYHYHTC